MANDLIGHLIILVEVSDLRFNGACELPGGKHLMLDVQSLLSHASDGHIDDFPWSSREDRPIVSCDVGLSEVAKELLVVIETLPLDVKSLPCLDQLSSRVSILCTVSRRVY